MSAAIGVEIRKAEADMVAALAGLVARPAVSPACGGRGEAAKADFVTGLCRSFTADIERRDAAAPGGARANVIARVPGRDPGAGRLWVIVHLDVVPPGDPALWSTDPFRAVVRDGRVYGRGAEDNGQSLVAAVFALKTLHRLGLTPARPVCLAAVADEENGSVFGLQHLVGEKLFAPGDEFLVPDGGSPDGSLVEVAEKGVLWLRVTTRGRQCHASRPQEGVNAMEAAADFTVRAAAAFRGRFAAADPLYRPPVSTFTPTRREANVPNINTVPGSDTLYFDCRVLPRYPLARVRAAGEEIRAAVEAAHGVRISLEPVQEQPGTETDPGAPLVRSLSGLIRRQRRLTPRLVGVGAGTCAAFVRRLGYPAVVWSTVCGTAHQPDEYAAIGNLLADAELLAHFMLGS